MFYVVSAAEATNR